MLVNSPVISFQDHRHLHFAHKHDNQIEQQCSGWQGFLITSPVPSTSPASDHQRWTLCTSPHCVFFRLMAWDFTQSLAVGPAGCVGTVSESALEMGPSGLLHLFPGPLAVVCLSVVLAGTPKWGPCCSGSWCAPTGACALCKAHYKLHCCVFLLPGDSANHRLWHYVPQWRLP